MGAVSGGGAEIKVRPTGAAITDRVGSFKGCGKCTPFSSLFQQHLEFLEPMGVPNVLLYASHLWEYLI